MMNRRTSLLTVSVALALCAGLMAAGCNPSEEEGEPKPKPPVSFDGKPEPKYAAVYKTADGRSTYTLKEDGSYTLVGKVSVQGRTFDNNVSGKWCIKDDRILFQDANGGVSPYTYRQDGQKLILGLTGTLKREIILVRQK